MRFAALNQVGNGKEKSQAAIKLAETFWGPSCVKSLPPKVIFEIRGYSRNTKMNAVDENCICSKKTMIFIQVQLCSEDLHVQHGFLGLDNCQAFTEFTLLRLRLVAS